MYPVDGPRPQYTNYPTQKLPIEEPDAQALTEQQALEGLDQDFESFETAGGAEDYGLVSLGDLRYAANNDNDAYNPEQRQVAEFFVAHPQLFDRLETTVSSGADYVVSRRDVNAQLAPFGGGGERAQTAYETHVAPTATNPADEWSVENAEAYTGALADQVELFQDDPVALSQLMTLATPGLQRSAHILGELADSGSGQNDTHEALAKNFSRLGNALPPDSAARIAYGIAEHIDDDSELWQVDDGFQKYIDDGGSSEFRDVVVAALVAQGKDEAAEELLVYHGGNGDSRFVPNLIEKPVEEGVDKIKDAAGWVADKFGDVAEKFKDVAGDVWNFVNTEVVDRIRDEVADQLGIEERITRLDEIGDYIELDAGISGSFRGLEAEIGAGAKVVKTEDGYAIELSGKSSVGLDLQGKLPGLGDQGIDASRGQSETIRFEFEGDNALEDAVRGAETIVTTPIGGFLGSDTADNLSFLTDHFSGATIELESGASIASELAVASGFSAADLSGSIGNSVAIEIAADGSHSLVFTNSFASDGSLKIPDSIALPSGGTLDPGTASASNTLDLTVRVPVTLSLDELIHDPVAAVTGVPAGALDDTSVTLSAGVQFYPGVKIDVPCVQLEDGQGVKFDLAATARPSDFARVLGQAVTGDLSGAFSKLGDSAEFSGSVRTVDSRKDPDPIKLGVNVGIASLEGQVDYTEVRYHTLSAFDDVTPTDALQGVAGLYGTPDLSAIESSVTETSADFRGNSATWTLDEAGRPIRVEADLTDVFSKLPRSSEERNDQREVGNRVRGNDDGGHLIGHRFLGDQGLQNLFPQNANFNRSAYLKLENEWADWTRQGCDVHVQVTLAPEGAERPEEVSVAYKIIDPRNGDEVVYDNSTLFLNEAGQKFDRIDVKDMPRYYG